MYTREDIASAIVERLDESTCAAARKEFAAYRGAQAFCVNDLLPQELALAIRNAFPDASNMQERKTIREHKLVTSQMDRHQRLGEEALFAFHDARVVKLVSDITGLVGLEADPLLYAGGLSMMTQGHFLNPHLDNSHNHDRSRYRVLNLLYYVSPDWSEQSGGHLELWPDGTRRPPLTLHSTFNRLVVMTTGPESWHSVCAVRSSEARCCVSNYYFSSVPLGGKDYFRVTSFRGRPEEPLKDAYLRLDSAVRGCVRTVFPKGFTKTKHIYRKAGEADR